jgi:cyclic pyranopterin phosphate synthase
MDVGSSNGWRMDEVLPSAEVVARIDRRFPLKPIDPNYSGESPSAGAMSTAAARSA